MLWTLHENSIYCIEVSEVCDIIKCQGNTAKLICRSVQTSYNNFINEASREVATHPIAVAYTDKVLKPEYRHYFRPDFLKRCVAY